MGRVAPEPTTGTSWFVCIFIGIYIGATKVGSRSSANTNTIRHPLKVLAKGLVKHEKLLLHYIICND